MKTKNQLVVLSFVAVLALAPLSVRGDEKAKRATNKAKQPAATGQTEVSKRAATGSHVQRTIRRNGFITDGPNNVVVIDQNAIQRSGASDLRQLLNRYGQGRAR